MKGRVGNWVKNLWWVLLLVAVHAWGGIYQTPLLEARWHVSAAKLSCQLSHRIPYVGQAIFRHEAGEPLSFQLVLENENSVTDASVRIGPAPWQHYGGVGRLLPVTAVDRQGLVGQRLSVQGQTAETMLGGLVQGRFPNFIYHSHRNGLVDETRILVSSVGFHEVYDRFQSCRLKLPTFGLKDFQDLRFFFREHQVGLPIRLNRILPNLAAYLSMLGKGRVVVVDPAARVNGKEGKQWFQKRWQKIRQVLIAHHLPSKRLVSVSQSHSKSKPEIKIEVMGPEGLRLYHYGRRQRVLTPRQKKRLYFLARYVKEFFPGRLVLHGHSDAARWRSETQNRRLAKQWAERIREYLLKLGVGKERISIKVWGSRRRVASNRSKAGQAQNRRVWVEFMETSAAPTMTSQGRHDSLANCCASSQSSTLSTSIAASG